VAVCSGTKRDGTPCTLPAMAGSEWCWNHDPARAAERSRNASHAATAKHSKIGQEIRSTRLLVRELLDLTLSNELHLQVRKRLTDVTQLLQVYCRLAELELDAGEKPAPGDVSLPEDTKERITEWTEGEDTKVREEEELVDELSQAMKARGYDPTPIRQVMGG
jgi:hypothetical protein